MTHSPTRAQELLEIVSKATPGPWGSYSFFTGAEHGFECEVYEHIGETWIAKVQGREQGVATAAAIACLPDLAAELRAALDEIERLRGALLTGAGLLEQGCNAMDMAASMRRVLEQNASHTAEIGKACRDE